MGAHERFRRRSGEPCRCRKCGGKIEDPSSLLALCYGCRLDLLVPSWYENAEDYGEVVKGDPIKARRQPVMGVSILSSPSPVRSDDIAQHVSASALAARIAREQVQGAEQDIGFFEYFFYAKEGNRL